MSPPSNLAAAGTLTFNGDTGLCLPLAFTPAAPEYHFFRTHFAGTDGVSEITAGSGLRTILVKVVVFGGFRTRNQLQQYCEQTMNVTALGSNSTLKYSSSNPKFSVSYPDCTFEGFAMDESPGMLYDSAGTLDGGWFCLGTLKFTQLSQQQ
jgi:hypothetical protein